MKRPYLVHFLAIKTNQYINIRASITLKQNSTSNEDELPQVPISAYKLLKTNHFTMKVVGLDQNSKAVYDKSFDTDSFGNLQFKIPLPKDERDIKTLQIYETRKRPGLDIHLGSYMPLVIANDKKIIICDFDKTLVDTRYSTTKEVYRSLTNSLDKFPTLTGSMKILKTYISEGHHPFIVSASPHFYEDAMRDWLYKNKVYSAGIFLKDYRKVFSLFEGALSPKDIKVQGMYKLGHLIDIILMTGIPSSLVLMGDNFESDPVIYLTMALIMHSSLEPWQIWNTVKEHKAFKPTKKQDTQFLNKIYQISSYIKNLPSEEKVDLKIFIRKVADEETVNVNSPFSKFKHLIELYDGVAKEDGQ